MQVAVIRANLKAPLKADATAFVNVHFTTAPMDGTGVPITDIHDINDTSSHHPWQIFVQAPLGHSLPPHVWGTMQI